MYIGVDLGGTNISVGLVDELGKVLLQKSTPTLAKRENAEIIKDMAMLCKDIMAEKGLTEDDIKCIGVGSPGTCDIKKGIILYAFNLGFDHVNLRDEMKAYFQNIPVYVANDADSAAYGEYKVGAGKAYNSITAITLGTGVGGGVIIGGKIINGSYSCGGELGHMVISVNGKPCSCGKKGCWEAYSSTTGLINMAKDAAIANNDSDIYKNVGGNLDNITGRSFFDALNGGDAVAKDVFDEYLVYLSEGLANVINMLEPEVIVIGGGISAQGDVILKPLNEKVNQRVFGGKANTILKIAELGNDAGIIGAALLGA
ncbi:MAG: ROK family protein [Lachnospirales bacterium]